MVRATHPDRIRLQTLLARLRDFELRLPQPHEQGVVEAARLMLREEIRDVSQRLLQRDYQRGDGRQAQDEREGG